jgi:hypothetical protein
VKRRELPYPELFDRSVRTLAATHAKFGDLSYYTPVQRIGCFMDNLARLKKKHILDLIAYLKTAQKKGTRSGGGQSMKNEEGEGSDRGETDDAEPVSFNKEIGRSSEKKGKRAEYLEHCLFLGTMPEEDGPGHLQLLSANEQQYEA